MTKETTLAEMKTAELISMLRSRGYFTEKVPPQREGLIFKPDVSRFNGKAFRFGVISCTHIGSRFQQLHHLHSYYRLAKRRGCEVVLHCGDVFDGSPNMHKGMGFEQFALGADAQLTYAISHYPSDVPTWAISGNHCMSFYKDNGFTIVKALADGRSDFTYLGDTLATIEFKNFKVMINHASGGVAYARSYKLQRGLDGLPSEVKPNFMFTGHWHVPAYLPQYRNVEAWSLPSFQATTPYMQSKQLTSVVGGLIVTVQPDKDGLGTVQWEYVPFYHMMKDDF